MYASIVGARPNFVKLLPICERLRERGLEHLVVHTGQHYDYEMSQAFFDDFKLPKPDYNLSIGSGSHAYQLSSALERIDEVLEEESPSLVLTYGDVNSTLAGALAAASRGIPTGHVEAGLRSFDKSMPEERNRVLTDHCSDLLFAPTEFARDQLAKEGILGEVFLTGDVMLEVFKESAGKVADQEPEFKDYYLATVHRPANTGSEENLAGILEAFDSLDRRVVFPMHPRTCKMVDEFGLEVGKNVDVIEPVKHSVFTSLLLHCEAVITDSGGIQKEAFFAKKPCITLRKVTEWVETVELGVNTLVGADKDGIVKAVKAISSRKPNWDARPYGNGKASQAIVDALAKKR